MTTTRPAKDNVSSVRAFIDDHMVCCGDLKSVAMTLGVRSLHPKGTKNSADSDEPASTDLTVMNECPTDVYDVAELLLHKAKLGLYSLSAQAYKASGELHEGLSTLSNDFGKHPCAKECKDFIQDHSVVLMVCIGFGAAKAKPTADNQLSCPVQTDQEPQVTVSDEATLLEQSFIMGTEMEVFGTQGDMSTTIDGQGDNDGGNDLVGGLQVIDIDIEDELSRTGGAEVITNLSIALGAKITKVTVKDGRIKQVCLRPATPVRSSEEPQIEQSQEPRSIATAAPMPDATSHGQQDSEKEKLKDELSDNLKTELLCYLNMQKPKDLSALTKNEKKQRLKNHLRKRLKKFLNKRSKALPGDADSALDSAFSLIGVTEDDTDDDDSELSGIDIPDAKDASALKGKSPKSNRDVAISDPVASTLADTAVNTVTDIHAQAAAVTVADVVVDAMTEGPSEASEKQSAEDKIGDFVDSAGGTAEKTTPVNDIVVQAIIMTEGPPEASKKLPAESAVGDFVEAAAKTVEKTTPVNDIAVQATNDEGEKTGQEARNDEAREPADGMDEKETQDARNSDAQKAADDTAEKTPTRVVNRGVIQEANDEPEKTTQDVSNNDCKELNDDTAEKTTHVVNDCVFQAANVEAEKTAQDVRDSAKHGKIGEPPDIIERPPASATEGGNTGGAENLGKRRMDAHLGLDDDAVLEEFVEVAAPLALLEAVERAAEREIRTSQKAAQKELKATQKKSREATKARDLQLRWSELKKQLAQNKHEDNRPAQKAAEKASLGQFIANRLKKYEGKRETNSVASNTKMDSLVKSAKESDLRQEQNPVEVLTRSIASPSNKKTDSSVKPAKEADLRQEQTTPSETLNYSIASRSSIKTDSLVKPAKELVLTQKQKPGEAFGSFLSHHIKNLERQNKELDESIQKSQFERFLRNRSNISKRTRSKSGKLSAALITDEEQLASYFEKADRIADSRVKSISEDIQQGRDDDEVDAELRHLHEMHNKMFAKARTLTRDQSCDH